jgi:hypothetical protein
MDSHLKDGLACFFKPSIRSQRGFSPHLKSTCSTQAMFNQYPIFGWDEPTKGQNIVHPTFVEKAARMRRMSLEKEDIPS